MEANPAQDWQLLTEHYREMSDGELEELAADFVDLTETAQQVLRGEMRSRGLGEPGSAGAGRGRAARSLSAGQDWHEDSGAGGFPSDPDGGGQEDSPAEFTWKTTLCECDELPEAWQIYEVLRQAGIESWIERPGYGVVYPRVLVAADQLEEAREVAARPIPQEIIDLSHMEEPEFEPPKCPECGAEDPVLESAVPANSWLCEACGKQWTDAAAAPDGSAESAER